MHDADGHPGVARFLAGRFQLHPAEVLQPRVELDALLELFARFGDLGPGRVAQRFRPVAPVRAVPLGEGAEEREVPQVAVFGRLFDVVRPQQLERGALGRPDGVVVDQLTVAVRGEGGDGLLRRRVGSGERLGGGDPQVDRVGEAAARRRVRRALDRVGRAERLDRVDQQHPRVQLGGRPGGEGREVAVVADAPRAGRVQGVELQHPAPRGRHLGQLRRHDGEHDVLLGGDHPVPAERQVRGQFPLDVPASCRLRAPPRRRSPAGGWCLPSRRSSGAARPGLPSRSGRRRWPRHWSRRRRTAPGSRRRRRRPPRPRPGRRSRTGWRRRSGRRAGAGRCGRGCRRARAPAFRCPAVRAIHAGRRHPEPGRPPPAATAWRAGPDPRGIASPRTLPRPPREQHRRAGQQHHHARHDVQ